MKWIGKTRLIFDYEYRPIFDHKVKGVLLTAEHIEDYKYLF